MKVIKVNGVPVKLQKHHFSKQLRLSISAGQAKVTLPKRTPYRVAEQFARGQADWISAKLSDSQSLSAPTKLQRQAARKLAQSKIEYWAPLLGVDWRAVRIGNQRSRWGSCSTSGTLSFNWRIIHLSEPLADYLVVHELAHVKHSNHSASFWQLVSSILPEYKQLRAELKQIDLQSLDGKLSA